MLHLLVAEFGILYFYNKTLSNKMAYPEFCFFSGEGSRGSAK